MRVIDTVSKSEPRNVQVYLSRAEAVRLIKQLQHLLVDPEANKHFHLPPDGDRDASFSIVTQAKIESGGYTSIEKQVLSDMSCE